MDPATLLIVSELVKVGVGGYLAYMKTQGATDEQIASVYEEIKPLFLANDPSLIPDV